MRPPSLIRPVLVLLPLLLSPLAHAGDQPLGFEELMALKQLRQGTLSVDGSRVAWTQRPDRGDPTLLAARAGGGGRLVIDGASGPRLSEDGRWLMGKLDISLEISEGKEAKKAKAGLIVVDLDTDEEWRFDRVKGGALAANGSHAVIHFHAAEPDSGEEKDKDALGNLRIRNLTSGAEQDLGPTEEYSLAPRSPWLSWVEKDSSGRALHLMELATGAAAQILHADSNATFPQVVWAEEGTRLAWLQGSGEASDGFALWMWDPTAGAHQIMEAGTDLSEHGELSFSRDGDRLFVGLVPTSARMASQEEEEETEEEDPPFDAYDREAMLEDREVVVWHWDDDLIAPHRAKREDDEKERTLGAVVHLTDGRLQPLATSGWPTLQRDEQSNRLLVSSNLAHRQAMTWSGFYEDWAIVDLQNGSLRTVGTMLDDDPTLSPDGNWVAIFENGDWYLEAHDGRGRRNLTAGLPASFSNERHDYPSEADSYGEAGWLKDSSAVLFYDRYDIWKFGVDGEVEKLTDGRGERISYRIRDITPDEDHLDLAGSWLLEAYDDKSKSDSLWRISPGSAPELLRQDAKLYGVVTAARDADRFLWSEESYEECPDYFSSSLAKFSAKRISDSNPELDQYRWGKSQLVHWNSVDGLPLDGVLITPPGWKEGQKVPVLVYFYRFMSQRLNQFNQPAVNHRPSFSVFASDGYAIFLPDIVFEEARPGLASLKCLVPGVQELVRMGVADPDRIALQGHSWAGYQAAWLATHTNIFAAIVSGAPVSNMTSAYGGIRYRSGLSRQFQYERGQSRIGASLWEDLPSYLENSPLFHADHIETPLLIQHGNADGAVPFPQAVELYMAMRRLGKPAVLLEYEGEPHHPKKYANKLDWSVKMKEFIDHFCLDGPEPEWWGAGSR